MQGFNMGRYYPPDASNPPTFNKTHPLGQRASKLSSGILTVRFELPFAVWCQHCKPEAIVGQGVRFNAEKKRVGSYYSTPIWAFRMKHGACGGWWEIRTEPQTAEYVVVEGARRREYGAAGGGGGEFEEGGELSVLGEEEREKRRADAFAGFEGKKEEKGAEGGRRERLRELYEGAEVWRDPYEVNARLRREMRGRRKVAMREERRKEGLQEKFGLGVEIVEELEADRVRAGLVEFGGTREGQKNALWKPLSSTEGYGDQAVVLSGEQKSKKEMRAEKSRIELQQTLVGNTRAAIDPFLSPNPGIKVTPAFNFLKKKTDRINSTQNTHMSFSSPAPPTKPTESMIAEPPGSLLLVDYDSE